MVVAMRRRIGGFVRCATMAAEWGQCIQIRGFTIAKDSDILGENVRRKGKEKEM